MTKNSTKFCLRFFSKIIFWKNVFSWFHENLRIPHTTDQWCGKVILKCVFFFKVDLLKIFIDLCIYETCQKASIFVVFLMIWCIVESVSVNCPFFENGHSGFRVGERIILFNYYATRYNVRISLIVFDIHKLVNFSQIYPFARSGGNSDLPPLKETICPDFLGD